MFENRLKELRESLKFNKKEMARELNLPYTTYVNYETNQREPNSEILILISNYFNVTIDYLLGISKNEGEKELNIKVNEKEYRLINSYREHPELHTAIDKMLDL